MTSPFIIQNDYDVINSAVRALLGQVTEEIAVRKSISVRILGEVYLNVEEKKKVKKR